RAARALMKSERRHLARLPLVVPVHLRMSGRGVFDTFSIDLSEGGMGVNSAGIAKNAVTMEISFQLPGGQEPIQCRGEAAWERAGQQWGIRFVDLRPEASQEIKCWINNQLAVEEPESPFPATMVDCAPDACYLETVAPLPVRTRVSVSLPLPGCSAKGEGVV